MKSGDDNFCEIFESFTSNKLFHSKNNENQNKFKEIEKIDSILNKWIGVFNLNIKIDFKREVIPEFKDG